MKNSLFILLIWMTSFVYSQEEPVNSPKIAIKIPIGEAITLENHTIKFIDVLEDSRCPKNTTCVWQGRARVIVEVSEKGKDTYQKTLIFGKTMAGESKDKELFIHQDLKVMGMMLNPYPNSEEKTKAPYELLVYKESN